MKEEVIKKNEADQRFDKYLKKRLPSATTGFLYKMLRKKNILLNNAKAEGSEKLKEGDRVSFYFSDETLRTFSAQTREETWMTDSRYHVPEILYETTDLIFLNKPAGLLSQKAKEEDFSANEQLLRYLFEKGDITKESLSTFRPAICNRLDRNTSGVLIGGKTLSGLQEAARLLKERTLEKTYHALVSGKMSEAMQTKAFLSKNPQTNRVTVTKQEHEGAFLIQTDYMPLETGEDWTLVSIRLITGKTHQIRAHLEYLGYPIIGDPKYQGAGSQKPLKIPVRVKRQMLHARECTMPDGTIVTAPYPADFSKTLDALRKIG